MKKYISELTGSIAAEMGRVVGSSPKQLPNNLRGSLRKNGELPLGNWQADVFRAMTGSDIAFQNVGGIRSSIPAGDVTYRNIYELSPFGNTIVTMKLTGAQVKDILEKSVSGRFGMLQVSGLKFKYDMGRQQGDRAFDVTVGGSPLSYKKSYKAVTNSFTAAGGDGFDTFKKAADVKDTGIIDRDIQLEYLKKHPVISASVEGRIQNVGNAIMPDDAKKDK
jgi:2',3'-cyclic-nucleotide 2'-phosphodiesterase (5'-nucleotidase family)